MPASKKFNVQDLLELNGLSDGRQRGYQFKVADRLGTVVDVNRDGKTRDYRCDES